MVVPSPSVPRKLALKPQVNNKPSDLMAAVWVPPADTAVHELVPICTGLFLFVWVSSPSCPDPLKPQVNNKPSDLMAAVWVPPADTAVHELVPICVGDDLGSGLFPTKIGLDIVPVAI
jgi:hypothetical protein